MVLHHCGVVMILISGSQLNAHKMHTGKYAYVLT